jgi:putative tryptophan/tyrosine transport system substrate-binding protein
MAARRTRAPAGDAGDRVPQHSPDKFVPFVDGFRQGLKRTGYVEGENVGIGWAEGNYDRLPALAADLVRRQVTVIAAIDGLPSILAAKAATGTIPVVFFTAADPIAFGLVASLNRPGGNVTGVVSLNAEIGPKRLELVHEVIPTATVMACGSPHDTMLDE